MAIFTIIFSDNDDGSVQATASSSPDFDENKTKMKDLTEAQRLGLEIIMMFKQIVEKNKSAKDESRIIIPK